MTAIFISGGKQYKVNEGDIVYLEKLPNGSGETVTFDNIVAVFDGDKVKLGTPNVAGVTVSANVIKTGKQKKIIVYKMHAKKNYRRKQGHRQPYTKIQINTITINA